MLIFCATTWECEESLNKFHFKKELDTPFEVWCNGAKRVIITGIGLVNASVAFAWAVKNFDFSEALNVGAAGLTSRAENASQDSLGQCYKISTVRCLEPYNELVFNIDEIGKTLVTASRPVSSLEERDYAGKFGELVDMEGYALARAASIFGKRISMLKMVTDFSQDCDIHANILSLSKGFAKMDEIWE